MKEKLHHHHKHEAEHLKERHKHKMAHHSQKEGEYKSHPKIKPEVGYTGMEHLIGGVVKDDHQQGISRKLLRAGDMDVGQHGSMSGGWEHKRMNQELTPRKG